MGDWERLLGFSLEILTATKSPQPWGSALTASLHRHHKVLLAEHLQEGLISREFGSTLTKKQSSLYV